jgi:phage head maturation protease
MNKRELRFISEAEVRLAGDDKSPVITGYAAVFNKPAQIMTRFQEVIRAWRLRSRAQREAGRPRALQSR